MNGKDIEQALLRSGLHAHQALSSAKVRGFQNQGMRHPVYLRLEEGSGANGPVRKVSPLVVHPEFRNALKALPPALGIGGIDDETFGSTYRGFPTKVNKGKAAISYGIPLVIPSAAALEAVIACLDSRSALQPSAPTTQPASVIDDLLRRAAEDELATDPQVQTEPATTRKALVDARIGQGQYRKGMDDIWDHRCAVTGCSLRPALVASHAKPWAESTNPQRLDPYNGLLLAASVDRLFDKGLISFADDGRLLLAEDMPASELSSLGLTPESRLRKVPDRLLPYLAEHRRRFSF